MNKRLICCFIVLVLCLSVFAGCATLFTDDDLVAALKTLDTHVRQIIKQSAGGSYQVPNKLGEDFFITDAKGNPATIYVSWEIEDSVQVELTEDEGSDTTIVNVPLNIDVDYILRATLTNARGKAYLKSNKKPYTIIFFYNHNTVSGSQGGTQGGSQDDNTGGNQGGNQGGQGTTPTEGDGTQAKPYTVAQALSIISKSEQFAYTSAVYVKGVVSGTASTGKSGDWKFDIVDSGSSNKLTVYYATLPSTVASSINEGDTVLVVGSLVNYNGTSEITSYSDGNVTCSIVSVTTGTGGGTGGNTGDNPGGGTVTGNTVTIDFSAQGYTNAQVVTSATVGNVSFTFAKAAANNDPAYYTAGTAVRLYGGGTLTVSGSSVTIKKIVITFGSDDKTNAITANTGSFATDTWTGSASSVVLTVASGSGHRRIKAIEVTFE